MTLDGTISNLSAAAIFLAAFVLGGNWIEHRWNPRPPLDRYRKDGGIPLVGFWNVFDESKFTPEAIEFHRRRLRATPIFLSIFALVWVVLDLIW
jgi:hypothetical protein